MSFCIATPMYGGQCTAEYHRSCLALQESFLAARIPHSFYTIVNESFIVRARNVMASRFLTDPEFEGLEALMFIDADIEFKPQDVANLWNLDEDVCCAAYARKLPGHGTTAWVGGRQVPLGGLNVPTAVDYAGTGFLMIRRRALAKMRDAYPELEYREGEPERRTWAFFLPAIAGSNRSATGVSLADPPSSLGIRLADAPSRGEDSAALGAAQRWLPSEDYQFCELWRRLGGTIWLDPSIRLTHWGRFGYTGADGLSAMAH